MGLLIEAHELAFQYPDGTSALDAVEFGVGPGEIVAVIGPSGAGKSTLLRCLVGLAEPTVGKVLHDQVDLADLAGRARRRALSRGGLVFQEFQLVNRATVLSNVLTGRLSHQRSPTSLVHVMRRADREIALGALVRVGLGEKARKRADALSGGQRQRVAIARALAQEPDALFADEPVTSLDPRLAQDVMADIVRLVRQEGLTAVLNLHDVALARQVADRVIGMRDGTVLWDRSASAVDDDDLEHVYGGNRPSTTAVYA